MNRVKIPVSSIIVKDRQRLDNGNLSDLVESLRIHGLIQPVVINQENRLIAGGRRLAAATQLGWSDIDVVYRETLTDDELHILELEENLRRKDETWQEKVLHIAHIHLLKVRQAGIEGRRWAQKMTGEMLGISDCHVNFNLQMASRLRAEIDPVSDKPSPTARLWKCETFADAWRLILRDEEDERMALLAELTQEQTNQGIQLNVTEDFSANGPLPIDTSTLVPINPTATVAPDDEIINGFSKHDSWEQFRKANGDNQSQFESNWAKFKSVISDRENTIYLSRRVIHGDSITYMNDPANAGRFNHIITDIPYGIDIEMLDQQNPHGGMKDIDTIKEEHDVEYNLKLIADFFPAAFACTQPMAFVITWCDQMLWQYMYDLAIKAGFNVQRWPITWYKLSSCMNQCAQYNFTKNTEIAIVCRKPNSTLTGQQPSSIISAAKDDLCDKLGHKFAKPFAVWEFLVSAVSIEQDEILEPFAGRGSGVLSMLQMNRRVTAVELQENHYNHLVENVKQHYLTLNPNFIFK